MTETGFTILKIPKEGGAYAFGLEARSHAINSTGAGGYLNAKAVASGWHDVEFATIVGAGVPIPVSIGATNIAAANLFSGAATVIGGSTPNGDLRSEADGYLGIGTYTPYNFSKGQEYSGAFFAIFKGNPSIANSDETGKIGIGTSSTEITTSGYYEGPFTTREIYEFQPSFTVDSTDLTKIPTGSGVYTNTPTLQFNILNRNGQALTSAAQIAADPFVKEQRISILNTDGTVVFPNYRVGGDSTFTLTRSQNIDVFGTYTRNFGIRNEVVNQDGGVHTSEFYLYANTVTFDKVFVRSSGETVLNENYTNHSPPNTGGINTAEYRADAIKYFNNQPVNESGATGFIEADIGFNEDSSYVALGDVTIWQGATKDFVTNRSSLVGNYPLNSIQQGQKIRLTANDGIPEGTPLFFKLAADSEVGFNEEIFTIGPITLEPEVEGPDLNLYNQGDQTLVGDFTIEAGLEGDAEDGGNLNVSGNALGTGEAGRLTGPTGIPYLLSGDAAGGGGSDTLQDVVDRGNATTTDINFNGSKIIFNGDSNASISYAVGASAVNFGSKITTFETSQEDTINLFTNNAVAIGASADVFGGSPATGSAVLGGTGNIISGHFNTLVGGAQNKISGDLFGFNFIGGGSGVDITNSQWSSSVGGYNNDVLSTDFAILAGGHGNLISGAGGAFLGGGYNNKIFGSSSVICGGQSSTIQGPSAKGFNFIGAGASHVISGQNNSILGGGNHKVVGDNSCVLGGTFNIISGDRSIAGGRKIEITHDGATVLSDGRNVTHSSSGDNSATFDFAGGVYVPSTGFFNNLHVSGVPVLTGENNPAEADTLQTVTDRGNTTTTSILSTGPHISGISGLFGDRVGIGLNNPEDFNSEANRLVVGDGVGAEGLTIFSGPAHSASICFADGTGGNSSYEGFIQYRHGDEGFRIGAGGGGKMFIGANNTVGIGTLAPNAELEIAASVATIRLTDSDLTNTFSEIEKGGDYLYFYSRANSSNGGFLFAGDNGTTETEFMRIATDGDVGIGSNVPSAKLDVAGGIKLLDNNYLTWNSSNTRIVGNSNYLQFQVAASDKVRITSAGNVGIGTTDPIAKINSNAQYFNPITDGNSTTFTIGTNNSASGKSNIILQSNTEVNDEIMGGVYFAHGSGQADAHRTVAAIESRVSAHGTVALNGANLLFFTKPKGAGRGSGDPQLFIGDNEEVGIGTGDPACRLHVNAEANEEIARFESQDNDAYIRIKDNTDSVFISHDASDDIMGLGFTQSASSSNLNINSAGNVGIGTTDPDAPLHVKTSSNINTLRIESAYNESAGGVATIKSTAQGSVLQLESATTSSSRQLLDVKNSDGTVFEIQGDGLVGIGTTDPDEKLEVYSGHLKVQSSPVGGVTPPSLKIGQVNNAYQAGLISSTHVTLKSTNGAGNIYFQPGNTYRGIVQNDGKMGVNTTTPNSTLHVEGDITGAGDVLGTGAGNRITNQGVPYLLSGDSPAETQTLQDVCDNGNTTTTSILSTGPHISGVTGLFADRVGIGVTDPESLVHIYGGNSTQTFSNINAGLAIENAGSSASHYVFQTATAGGGKSFSITNAGNVGIGTDAATTPGGTARLSLQASSVPLSWGVSSTQFVYHRTLSANKFQIQAHYGGNVGELLLNSYGENDTPVGIGTTDCVANVKLHVEGVVSGSNSFLGTGVGNRITNNGVPYLLSGDSPAENDTLQDVTTRGNTTTTSIVSTGPHISGVTGLFSNQVGIGTNNPAAPLHIQSSTDHSKLRITNDNSQSWGLMVGNSGYYQGYFMIDQVGAGQRLAINDLGYVGIGSNAPQGLLDVKGDTDQNVFLGRARFGSHVTDYLYLSHYDNATSTSYALKQSPAGSTAINAKASMNVSMNVNNDPIVFVKGSTSRVGIGTTGPARKLDVSTDGSDTYGIRNSYNSSYYMEMAHNRFNTVGNNYIRFNIDDATKMTIVDADFGGGVNGVGIGITNPTAELQVIGDISGSGSFLGTGVGNRITNNGVPYLLSGDSPAETQTLQDVCDNGNTTTTAVNITGAITVANHIFKNVENSFLGLYGGSDTLTNDGFIKIYGNSSNWGKVQTNIGYDATNSKAHWTLNNTTELMTLKGDGSLGIGTTSPNQLLHVDGKTQLGTMGNTEGGAIINYASFSETKGGAATLLGNAVYAGTANNTYVKTKNDAGNLISMTYNKGICFHTNVTGNAGFQTSIDNHEQVRITTGGFLGVGTNSPEQPFHLAATNYKPALIQRTAGTNCYLLLEDQNTTLDVGVGATTNDLKFRAGNSDHMKLDAGGDLFLGSPTDSADKLMVQANTNYHAARFNGHTDGGQSYGVRIRAGTNTVDYGLLVENTAGDDLFKVNGVGDITGAGSFLGTGLEGRITLNGTGYLLSGDSPAETQTLQDVTDNGATTTNAIEVANGTIISGSAATTPAADLYVFGSGNSDVINAVRDRNDASIKVTSTTAGAYFRTNSATATYNGLDLNSNWFIGQYGYNDLRIVDGTASAGDSAAAITIQDSTKNVGIGTTDPYLKFYVDGNSRVEGNLMVGSAARANTPQTALHVKSSSTNARIRIEDSDSSNQYWDFYVNQGDGLHFNEDTDTRVTFKEGGNVGIGTSSPSNALDVVGHFSATSKSFLIDHPTKENKKLQYGSLEGPENGVYVRGTTDKETIELPEYWSELVHDESITVVLTPIGKKQDLFIIKKSNKLIKIGGVEGSFDYVVYGERKDIDKLEVEPLKV